MAYTMGYWSTNFHSIFTHLQTTPVDVSRFSISDTPNDNMLELVRIIFILSMNQSVPDPQDRVALTRILFTQDSGAYKREGADDERTLSLFETFSMFDLARKQPGINVIDHLVSLYSRNELRRAGLSQRIATLHEDQESFIGLAIMLYYCFLIEYFFTTVFDRDDATPSAKLLLAVQMLERWIEGSESVPVSLGAMDLEFQTKCQVHNSLTRELINYVTTSCTAKVPVMSLNLGAFKSQFRPILARFHSQKKDTQKRFKLINQFLLDISREGDKEIADQGSLQYIVAHFHRLILDVHAEKSKALTWYGASKPMTTTTADLCAIHKQFFPSVDLPKLELALAGFAHASVPCVLPSAFDATPFDKG